MTHSAIIVEWICLNRLAKFQTFLPTSKNKNKSTVSRITRLDIPSTFSFLNYYWMNLFQSIDKVSKFAIDSKKEWKRNQKIICGVKNFFMFSLAKQLKMWRLRLDHLLEITRDLRDSFFWIAIFLNFSSDFFFFLSFNQRFECKQMLR